MNVSKGTVFTYLSLSRLGPPLRGHQRIMLAADAKTIAGLKLYEFGGPYDSANIYRGNRHIYFVPDDTLLLDEAESLGIRTATDLYGGVVPHAFAKNFESFVFSTRVNAGGPNGKCRGTLNHRPGEGRGRMTNWDSQTFTNISTDTEVFNLAGGKYGMSAIATWKSGSVTLQILAADESTWLAAATPFTADGFQTADLPPGQYRFHVANATAAYVAINGIPYD